jgi:alkanesulfonate monooxygenase SsuD/methylene tetrahydromethanopterin reductase-like flavin-dependent oxidoreductase (luciferase family)
MSGLPAPRFGAMIFSTRYEGQTDADVLARAVAAAQAAEVAGFDDVWVTEHHFGDFGVNPSALTLAAFLLGRTNRVRVGTAVTLLPLHSPVHVAEQAALLDHVSGGRFDLGVGRAGPVVDYEVIGRGIEYWHDGLPEAIDLMLSTWDGKAAADSALYRFREVRPRPRPLTQPHVPTLLAANSSSSVDTAAAKGLPMLFMFTKSNHEIAAMVARHAEMTVSHGHSVRQDHGYTALTQVVDTPAAAEDMVRRLFADVGKPDRTPLYIVDQPHLAKVDSDEFRDGLVRRILADHPIGTPKTCIQRLVQGIRDSGCRRVLCHVEVSADHDGTLTSIERLGRDVLPEVRDAFTETPCPKRELR